MKLRSKSFTLVLSIAFLLVWTTPILASDNADGIPLPIDTLIVRPVGVVATVVGAVVFVVSLPFVVSASGTHKAADELVMKPFRFTFKRPLGEYKKRDAEEQMRGWAITQNPESRILDSSE